MHIQLQRLHFQALPRQNRIQRAIDMRPDDHVVVLDELAEHFEDAVFRELLALVFALNTQAQVHEQRRRVLQTVLWQILVGLLLQGRNDPLDDVLIYHYGLGVSPQTKFLQRSQRILAQRRVLVLLAE